MIVLAAFANHLIKKMEISWWNAIPVKTYITKNVIIHPLPTKKSVSLFLAILFQLLKNLRIQLLKYTIIVFSWSTTGLELFKLLSQHTTDGKYFQMFMIFVLLPFLPDFVL